MVYLFILLTYETIPGGAHKLYMLEMSSYFSIKPSVKLDWDVESLVTGRGVNKRRL